MSSAAMLKAKQHADGLAIQDTLRMTQEERIELLAALIAEKILADEQRGGPLLAHIEAERLC